MNIKTSSRLAAAFFVVFAMLRFIPEPSTFYHLSLSIVFIMGLLFGLKAISAIPELQELLLMTFLFGGFTFATLSMFDMIPWAQKVGVGFNSVSIVWFSELVAVWMTGAVAYFFGVREIRICVKTS